MPSDSREQWSQGFERLHPSSLIFGIARLGKALLLPALIVLLFSRKGNWDFWLAIFFIPAALIEAYRFLTVRYRVHAGELIVRRGLLFRTERHVPLQRVQNVDVAQNPFHRLMNVAEVRIETAGGSEPEASFKVLSLDAIDLLRRQIFAGREQPATATTGAPMPAADGSLAAPPTTATEPPRELLHIPTIELLKLGLISNRGMALIAVVFGLSWEFDLFDRIDVGSVFEWTKSHTGGMGWLGALVVVIAALLAMRVLSVGWVLLRFFDYRLTRSGDDFRLSCGLLTRVTATVPRRRIQLVSLRQTLLQRLIRRASIRIETAGGGGGGDDGQRDTYSAVSRRWFVPTIPIADAPRLLNEIHEGLDADFAAAPWQPLAPKARRRMMRGSLKLTLPVGIILGVIWWPWGAIAGGLLAAALLWHAHRAARYMAYARTERCMLFRSGVTTRCISAAFLDKVQVVSLHESPFDRRWRMASVGIDTAGAGPADHLIHVPCLPRDVAESLAAALYADAEAMPSTVQPEAPPPAYGALALSTEG